MCIRDRLRGVDDRRRLRRNSRKTVTAYRMDATRRPDVGAVARRTMPDYLLKTVGLVYYSVEDLNLRSSHDRCNNSVHINGCQSRASTDMDTHRGTIRKRAIAAIQPEPGAATCEPVALQATKASLLLSAVEIARDACGELMKDENTKRVGILVLYPKNDEMVNDLRVNLKDCGGEDVDVVACTENKEKFDDCLLYTSPSPRDRQKSRMPSSA